MVNTAFPPLVSTLGPPPLTLVNWIPLSKIPGNVETLIPPRQLTLSSGATATQEVFVSGNTTPVDGVPNAASGTITSAPARAVCIIKRLALST
jgi:hypothetical protein